MPYAAPPRWSHGGTNVSAARMNIYSTNQDIIDGLLGSASYSLASPSGQSEATFYLIHKFRYLWFASNGAIEDVSGVGEPVSVTEENSTFTQFDLDTVDWLFYGDLYKVTGVSWCAEDDD